MIWGWIGVSLAMLCIALGMAELASAYPTSGGMYYYQFRLAGRRTGPFACWITGVCASALPSHSSAVRPASSWRLYRWYQPNNQAG